MVTRQEETQMNREQTTIRLPTDLKEQIQREADRRGQSFNGMILDVLTKFKENRR